MCRVTFGKCFCIFVLVLLVDNCLCGTMEFNLDQFKANPTLAQVDPCRVVDLTLTAAWLGVDCQEVGVEGACCSPALAGEVFGWTTGVGDDEEGPSAVPCTTVLPVAPFHHSPDPANVSGMSA